MRDRAFCQGKDKARIARVDQQGMDKFAFMPLVDVPLTVLSLWAFIYHIHRWVHCRDVDTSIDLQARLPSARVSNHRIVCRYACALLALRCGCLAALRRVYLNRFVVALISEGTVESGAFGPLAAAFLIRELAFGFPQIILHPESRDSIATVSQSIAGELVERPVSPRHPCDLPVRCLLKATPIQPFPLTVDSWIPGPA